MHEDWQIERWEEEYVYTHIQVAQCQFGMHELPNCHWVPDVVFRADVASDLMSAFKVSAVEVHPCLGTSRVSLDSVLCPVGAEGSCPVDYPKA